MSDIEYYYYLIYLQYGIKVKLKRVIKVKLKGVGKVKIKGVKVRLKGVAFILIMLNVKSINCNYRVSF